MAPCTDDSVVCAQLRDIVRSGTELCHFMGFNRGVGSGDDAGGDSSGLSAAVSMVKSGEVEADAGRRCYAGRAMKGRGAARGGGSGGGGGGGGFSHRRPASEAGGEREGRRGLVLGRSTGERASERN